MPRTLNKAKDTEIALLRGRGMEQKAICEALGVSRNTVLRSLRRQAETIDQAEQKLRSYQNTVQSVVPDIHRATRMKKAIDSDNHMAALRAIEHIDAVMGFTGRDRESAPPQQAPTALFQLPAGSTVGVIVKPPDQGK